MRRRPPHRRPEPPSRCPRQGNNGRGGARQASAAAGEPPLRHLQARGPARLQRDLRKVPDLCVRRLQVGAPGLLAPVQERDDVQLEQGRGAGAHRGGGRRQRGQHGEVLCEAARRLASVARQGLPPQRPQGVCADRVRGEALVLGRALARPHRQRDAAAGQRHPGRAGDALLCLGAGLLCGGDGPAGRGLDHRRPQRGRLWRRLFRL